MDARVIPAADLPGTKLDRFSCVVLCNVGHLDGSDLLKIENFLRKGGGVLIFLGNKVNAEHYNKWTFLPVSLTEPMGDPTKERSFGIGKTQEGHNIFPRDIDLRSARFFLAFGCDSRTLRDGGTVLASFTNGQPAVVEGKFDKGKILLVTSTCDIEWNNLPLRRAFLPWLYRTIYYLSGRETKGKAFRLNEEVVFQALAAQYRKTITVKDPEGIETVLRPRVRAGYAEAEYAGTSLPGLYEVDADSAFTNSGGFAVNVDTAESMIDLASAEEIAAASPTGVVEFVESPQRGVVEQVARAREGKRLWPFLFKLAALVFVLESAVANFMSRTRGDGESKAPLFDMLRQRTPGIVQ